MRTQRGSTRDLLQRLELTGVRMPHRIYPSNRNWRYNAKRDRVRLNRMALKVKGLCEELLAKIND